MLCYKSLRETIESLNLNYNHIVNNFLLIYITTAPMYVVTKDYGNNIGFVTNHIQEIG